MTVKDPIVKAPSRIGLKVDEVHFGNCSLKPEDCGEHFRRNDEYSAQLQYPGKVPGAEAGQKQPRFAKAHTG